MYEAHEMLYSSHYSPAPMGYLFETMEEVNARLDTEERLQAFDEAMRAYRKRWPQYVHLLPDDGPIQRAAAVVRADVKASTWASETLENKAQLMGVFAIPASHQAGNPTLENLKAQGVTREST